MSVQVNAAGVELRDYAPLPFTPATPFRKLAPRSIWIGSTSFDPVVTASDINATACPGSATAPAPTAGQLCIYPRVVTNLSGIFIHAGVESVVDPR